MDEALHGAVAVGLLGALSYSGANRTIATPVQPGIAQQGGISRRESVRYRAYRAVCVVGVLVICFVRLVIL